MADREEEIGDLAYWCGVYHAFFMHKALFYRVVFLTLVAATGIGGFVGWRFWEARAVLHDPYQGADHPLSMPAQGEVDHRFDFLSAWQAVQIPCALRFDPPMGTEHGGLVYNAQKFWEMNEKRGGHHTGDDLNGIGGMNTDLGDPVFSIADGLVLYAGNPSPGWGNVLVIAHSAPDGRTFHSMYAHLERIEVTRGALVARGGRLGTVGTANGYYLAHLHFEIRASDGVDIGGGYASTPLNRLDPTATILSLRHAAAERLSPSPLARALTQHGTP